MAKRQAVLIPGTVLKESFMDVYHITTPKLAEDIKLSQSAIRQLINNKLKISISIALRLAKYFGTPVNYWIELQTAYDLLEMEQDAAIGEMLRTIPKAKKAPAAASKGITRKPVADTKETKTERGSKDAPKKAAGVKTPADTKKPAAAKKAAEVKAPVTTKKPAAARKAAVQESPSAVKKPAALKKAAAVDVSAAEEEGIEAAPRVVVIKIPAHAKKKPAEEESNGCSQPSQGAASMATRRAADSSESDI